MELLLLIVKALIMYVTVYISIRFMGKRELGQLSIIDLIILLIIADVGVLTVESTDVPFWNHISVIVLLAVIQKLSAIITLKNVKIRKAIEGEESIIIFDGKLNITEMKNQKYSVDDLVAQLREKGIRSISEVDIALLENNGTLSVFEKEDKNISPLPIIVSGVINSENLKLNGLSLEKLNKLLTDQELAVEDIYYASYENNQLFISKTIEISDK